MLDKATLIYTEYGDSWSMNEPHRLLETFKKYDVVTTNDLLVVACFRSLVRLRLIDKGIIDYHDQEYKLDKYGHYESKIPPYEDLYDQYLMSLL